MFAFCEMRLYHKLYVIVNRARVQMIENVLNIWHQSSILTINVVVEFSLIVVKFTFNLYF